MTPTKPEFDLDRIADVPDPLSGVGSWPLPPRRDGAVVPSPTRSRVTAFRATAFGLALLYELAWVAIMNKRGDLHTISRVTLFVEVAAPAVVALLALAAVPSGERGLGQPKGRLATLLVLSPAIFVAATLIVSPGDVDDESFWLHALRCFLWTGLYAAGPFALAAWVFRRSFAALPAWRSAALGMACGAAGMATMSLVCSVGSPAHVLVGHGSVMLVAAVAGALLGRRFGEA